MKQEQTRNYQTDWWPALLDEWTGPLMVAGPGNYADHLPADGSYLTCQHWTGRMGRYRGRLSLSRYDMNIIHGQTGSGKSSTVQVLLNDLCQSNGSPGLTGSVLTGTRQAWKTWTTRMAHQELARRFANINILSSVNIWTDTGLTLLMDRLTEQKPDILVLDCLNDFLPPGHPSGHHTWTALYRNLNIINRQAEQQTGNQMVMIGIVLETGTGGLMNKGDYAEWNQAGLTLRVIPSSDIIPADHTADAYTVLYPTAGGKNRAGIPGLPVSIHRQTADVRADPAGHRWEPVEWYTYGGNALTSQLTDIPGLKPESED